MAQPTKSNTKTPATPPKASAIKAPKPAVAHTKHQTPNTKHSEGLHYNKEDLHADYARTYTAFMAALAVGVVGALIYFFIMIIYLGAKGHTPTDDYVREFGSRIQYDYKGLRLPEYDDPTLLDKKTDKDSH